MTYYPGVTDEERLAEICRWMVNTGPAEDDFEHGDAVFLWRKLQEALNDEGHRDF